MWHFITKRGFKIHRKIKFFITFYCTHLPKLESWYKIGKVEILCSRRRYGSPKKTYKGAHGSWTLAALSLSISLIQSSGFSLERERERKRVAMAEVWTLPKFKAVFKHWQCRCLNGQCQSLHHILLSMFKLRHNGGLWQFKLWQLAAIWMGIAVKCIKFYAPLQITTG